LIGASGACLGDVPVAQGLVGLTWVDVLLHIMVQNGELRTGCRMDMFDLHAKMSLRVASHMQQTFENISRFAWLLGGMLHTDPDKAQESARNARSTLLLKASQSPIAIAFANDALLMQQLGQFCDESPPTHLWKRKGKFKDLFYFVAARFMSAPDHVLDCEGIHARWKWIAETKRGMKLKQMNSVLKLAAYIHNHGDLPCIDTLLPHIDQIRQHYNQQYANVVNDGVVAPGMRAEHIHRDRFNLDLTDWDLLNGPHHNRHGGKSSPAVHEISTVALLARVCSRLFTSDSVEFVTSSRGG
jgi:hypothetical protein